MTTANQPQTACLQLPAVLDLKSAGPLSSDLLALRGRPVSLDASRVTRLGGLGLQVLLSARLSWRAAGLGFTIVDRSDAFKADCALLGAAGFDDFNGAPDHG